MVGVIKLNLIGKGLRKISTIKGYLWTSEGASGLDPGKRIPFCATERHQLGGGRRTITPNALGPSTGAQDEKSYKVYAQDQLHRET